MSAPLPPQLSRSVYLDWPPGGYNPQADPNSPSFEPSMVGSGGGDAGYVVVGDTACDIEQYFRPLERIHGSGLHLPGIASGLEISCTLNSPGVQVMPGIALDPSGKHIYLGANGKAQIDPNFAVPNTTPSFATVDPALGATLPTAGYAGPCYVVVQWCETYDSSTYTLNPDDEVWNDTPWLLLVDKAHYDPDLQVVLGIVELDPSNNGNVLSASYGDVGGLQRTSASVPVQSVQLFRAATASSGATQGANTVSWGEVRAREAGGIEIVTQNTGDQVNVITQGGGNFSSMAIAADQATVGELSSPSIVLNSADSKVLVGTTSNPGVVLDGSEAAVYVGAPGNYGDVIVYDGGGHFERHAGR